MMIKKTTAFIISLVLVFSAVSCGFAFGEMNERFGIYLRINAPQIQSMEMDLVCGDVLRKTTGCSNADNTEMKIGQVFGFDTPESNTKEFICDITFKTMDGKEINNEKTKVTLPPLKDKYELEVSLDENGEYAVYIISVTKEDKNG